MLKVVLSSGKSTQRGFIMGDPSFSELKNSVYLAGNIWIIQTYNMFKYDGMSRGKE